MALQINASQPRDVSAVVLKTGPAAPHSTLQATPAKEERKWTNTSSVLLFALAIAGPLSSYWACSSMGSARVGWVLSTICLALTFGLIGQKVNNRPLGVLIDSRYVMSLSRFQMVAW